MVVNAREYEFEGILNFRDLGGYSTGEGRRIAWRRLFRSASLDNATAADLSRLKNEIDLKSVLNLRVADENNNCRRAWFWENQGVQYLNIPLKVDPQDEKVAGFSEMGSVYSFRLRQPAYAGGIRESFKYVAQPKNMPLVFHCGMGKDRSGVLAALLLASIGVSEIDIIKDYQLTQSHKKALMAHLTAEKVNIWPAYSWDAEAGYMERFLAELKKNYGSAQGYLESIGIENAIITSLKQSLLESI